MSIPNLRNFSFRTWSGFVLIFALQIVISWGAISIFQNSRIQGIKDKSQQDIEFLHHIIQEKLQEKNYQSAEALVQLWGQQQTDDIAEITLTMPNNFVLGEYRSESRSNHLASLSRTISYSYTGSATLHLEVDLGKAYLQSKQLGYVFGIFIVVFSTLLAIMAHLLIRKENLTKELSTHSHFLAETIEVLQSEITAREQAEDELRDNEKKLHRAERMEAIGLMASGVAHDLNNILSGIVSYPELLLMRLPKDSDLHQPLNVMKESGLRAAAVVDDLLTVAREAATVRTQRNMNMLVQEYLQSPEADKVRSLYPQVSISADLMPEDLMVNCSVIHVKKCIMNLVLNAAEAIGTVGKINIRTAVSVLSKDQAASIMAGAGRYVVVIISDDGPGISEEDQQHIFEPFYTKKEMGRSGTGIGLAVVWSCMQDHEGTVSFKSDEQGTSFTLYFPVDPENFSVLDKPDKGEAKNIDLTLKGNGERILVVDDEAQQRDIAVQVLTELGYQATMVSSGERATAAVATQPVDLLLLDMVMDPGIDGLQTYQKIKEKNRDQKALIVSGFSEHEKVEAALLSGVSGFLKKPYTVSQLATAVKNALAD